MIRLNSFLLGILVLAAHQTVAHADSSPYNNPASQQAISEPHQSNPAPEQETKTQQNNSPVEAIQSAIIKLNQLTNANIYSPRMMSALIDEEVAPMFDFHYIAHEVLLVANASSDEDLVAFVSKKLRTNIITTLLSRLAQANSTSVRFISARPIMGGKIAVQLKVEGYSRYGIFLDLLFHQNSDEKWQIFDIVLNQDSLINYYQKMVSVKLRRYGLYGMLSRI